jgi:2-phosphoglycerate kinase
MKKGETLNPNGRPRKLVSDVIKELENQGVKPVTKQEIQDVYMRLINLEMPDLEAKVKDSKQPALVRIVGKAILSGKGYEVIERMLDRSIGKPDTKTDITTNNKDINTNITLTDEQLKYVIESITPDD